MTPGCSTICLPLDQDDYLDLIDSPPKFRRWLDQAFRQAPELFPEAFAKGYTLKERKLSAQLGLPLRRIRGKAPGAAFTVRPSFVLPYLTGYTADVENPLFLRRLGVPFWALARVFGKDARYWYRLEVGLGRHRLVGTTVRTVALPPDVVADEHHQTPEGDKVFIAPVVAGGCCLGAGVVDACAEEALKKGYGVFQQEAQDVEEAYTPQTVNTDGWQATQLAWRALVPLVVVLRCFLHGWLSIRDGCRKPPLFHTRSEKIWQAYHATDRRTFSQRRRRVREWAERTLTGEILTRTLRLCGRTDAYGRAYAHPKGHRTSTMLDRVLRSLNSYFSGGQHLHGSTEATRQHARAWALLHNFAPWCPATERASGYGSPAERLNGHRYHDNWLDNLLVSASLAGYRHGNHPPHNP